MRLAQARVRLCCAYSEQRGTQHARVVPTEVPRLPACKKGARAGHTVNRETKCLPLFK